MSEVPFKIIHISDLHICDKNLVKKIEMLNRLFIEFSNEVSNLLTTNKSNDTSVEELFNKDKLKLDIEFHDIEKVSDLVDNIVALKPNVVCLTGDITTYGDPLSFKIAKEQVIDKISSENCRVLIVPGNHDYLFNKYIKEMRSYINNKYKSLPWYIKRLIKSLKNKVGEINKAILDIKKFVDDNSELQGEYDTDFFDEFCTDIRHDIKEYQSEFIYNKKNIDGVNKEDKCKVRIFLIDSTSKNWPLMNRGEWDNTRISHVKNLNNAPEVRIVMLHHHPLSSSKVKQEPVVSAYNGMKGGEQFLYQMQKRGIDLVLHGHQHTKSLYRIDIIPNERKGPIYVAGVPAAAAKDNECGFNIYEIKNDLFAAAHEWNYDSGSYKNDKEKDVTFMVFDPIQTEDVIARHARKEIRKFTLENDAPDSLWNNITAGKEIYHFGVDHEKLVDHQRFENYCSSYKDGDLEKLFILINRSDLFDVAIEYDNPNPINLSTIIEDLWGDKDKLGQIPGKIARTIKAFDNFKTSLKNDLEDEEVKKRLEKKRDGYDIDKDIVLKETHSVIPYSATVSNPNEYDAKMVIKLMPYGALYKYNASVPKPVMQIEKRRDQYLFNYYWDHLKVLWDNSANKCR